MDTGKRYPRYGCEWTTSQVMYRGVGRHGADVVERKGERMSRESIVSLAKASWALVVLYMFGNKIVGGLIGPVLADLLAFALGLLAVGTALFCLFATRRHGGKGIVVHAVVGLLLGLLVLAIWIPNFLAARERARARRGTAVESSGHQDPAPAGDLTEQVARA